MWRIVAGVFFLALGFGGYYFGGEMRRDAQWRLFVSSGESLHRAQKQDSEGQTLQVGGWALGALGLGCLIAGGAQIAGARREKQ